jgi:hypothetical protein
MMMFDVALQENEMQFSNKEDGSTTAITVDAHSHSIRVVKCDVSQNLISDETYDLEEARKLLFWGELLPTEWFSAGNIE